MKWKEWLENWNMTSLKISAWVLEMEWSPKDADKAAAWELYVELLTRITTQPLSDGAGTEASALESIYFLFPVTREIIKRHGRESIEFTKISVVILNQIVRPFTARWHPRITSASHWTGDIRSEFRRELNLIQVRLGVYTRMLGEMAGVEVDLTRLEAERTG